MEISQTTQKFIQAHAKDDPNTLRLKYEGKSSMMDFPIDFALSQIEARRKAQKKIPSFIENVLFVFPDTLSAEQASNETVAKFHASLIPSDSNLLDLTAGLGIDDLTFAMSGINVTACEINEVKATALRHNSEVFRVADRITVLNIDSMDFVRSCGRHFDVVFSDPARRSSSGKRLHALSDCQPDILGGMDSIMKLTDRLLIKCSPLLDISLIRKTVCNLYQIYVVCFKGECKEVLMDIRKASEFSGVTAVDLDTTGIISKFEWHHSPTTNAIRFADRACASDYKYLYEPNAGVMKTNAWEALCVHFPEMEKADPNTHIFLSDVLYKDFPGRIMTISEIPDKKALKALKGHKYNIVARNHPLSAPEVAKKLSLVSGGDRFLYALRYEGKPIYILAAPLESRS